MRAFADKLIEVLENHTEEVSKQWSKAVSSNPRTPSFHSLDPEKYTPHAVHFFRDIRMLYFSEEPHERESRFFVNFAKEMHAAEVPLPEIIYALILMRRHIWLFADFNALFITTMDMHQAVESINRTILMFDYIIHSVTQCYDELTKETFRKM
jgi:hypothetical protein